MPMDLSRYPDDWPAISRRIRERSGGRCEWCGAANGKPNPRTGSRVILTVAHLGAPQEGSGVPWGDPHDKHDVRDCNLVALCQSCHLGYDRDDHARNAAKTRRARRIAAGQVEIGAALSGLLGGMDHLCHVAHGTTWRGGNHTEAMYQEAVRALVGGRIALVGDGPHGEGGPS